MTRYSTQYGEYGPYDGYDPYTPDSSIDGSVSEEDQALIYPGGYTPAPHEPLPAPSTSFDALYNQRGRINDRAGDHTTGADIASKPDAFSGGTRVQPANEGEDAMWQRYQADQRGVNIAQDVTGLLRMWFGHKYTADEYQRDHEARMSRQRGEFDYRRQLRGQDRNARQEDQDRHWSQQQQAHTADEWREAGIDRTTARAAAKTERDRETQGYDPNSTQNRLIQGIATRYLTDSGVPQAEASSMVDDLRDKDAESIRLLLAIGQRSLSADEARMRYAADVARRRGGGGGRPANHVPTETERRFIEEAVRHQINIKNAAGTPYDEAAIRREETDAVLSRTATSDGAISTYINNLAVNDRAPEVSSGRTAGSNYRPADIERVRLLARNATNAWNSLDDDQKEDVQRTLGTATHSPGLGAEVAGTLSGPSRTAFNAINSLNQAIIYDQTGKAVNIRELITQGSSGGASVLFPDNASRDEQLRAYNEFLSFREAAPNRMADVAHNTASPTVAPTITRNPNGTFTVTTASGNRTLNAAQAEAFRRRFGL